MATLDIFQELGAEPAFVQIYPEEYELRRLNQVDENEVYKGKPVLGEINSFEKETDQFDESGSVIMETIYNMKFGLIDDEKEIILEIPIKIKNDDAFQTNIHPASSLNKLIIGVVQTMGGEMGDCNTFKKINLDNLRELINKIPLMKVKIIEKSGGSFLYNTFVTVDPSKDYDGEALVE